MLSPCAGFVLQASEPGPLPGCSPAHGCGMNTPTVINVTAQAEFLGMIPHLLGNLPSRNVVLIPFEGNRAHGAFRVDLPPLDAPMNEWSHALVALLCRVEGATGAAFVVYTDGPIVSATADWASLAEDVELACLHAGLALKDSLVVADDGWGDFTKPTEIHDQVPEPAELDGMPRPASRLSSAVLPDVTVDTRKQVNELLDRRDASAVLDRPDLITTIEQPLSSGDPLSASELADIALILATPASRDVALLQWSGSVTDGEPARAFQQAYLNGFTPTPDASLTRIFGQGARPDLARLEAALSVARQAAAAATEPYRSGPLTVCAWLSWARGSSSEAAAYLEQVNPFSRAASFAHLLSDMIEAQRLPEWLFTRR